MDRGVFVEGAANAVTGEVAHDGTALPLRILLNGRPDITETRPLTNLGNAQSGTAGFYIDETAARWTGLGGAGSSIAATHSSPA